MNLPALPLGLPGSPEPSAEYLCAVDVLGGVIASRAAAIAREQARCRRDPAVLASLETDRATAVRALTGLDVADRQGLRAIAEKYRRLS